jgi:hypothetical protein
MYSKRMSQQIPQSQPYAVSMNKFKGESFNQTSITKNTKSGPSIKKTNF